MDYSFYVHCGYLRKLTQKLQAGYPTALVSNSWIVDYELGDRLNCYVKLGRRAFCVNPAICREAAIFRHESPQNSAISARNRVWGKAISQVYKVTIK